MGDPVGLTARLPFFAPTDPACVNALPFDTNTSWTNAEQIPLDGNGNGGVTNEAINISGESRWYKFNVTPGGTVQVDLSNLPANYDLALFTDIGQAYNDITDARRPAAGERRAGRVRSAPRSSRRPFFTPTLFTPDVLHARPFFTPTFFTPGLLHRVGLLARVLHARQVHARRSSRRPSSPGDESAYESAQYRSLFGISVQRRHRERAHLHERLQQHRKLLHPRHRAERRLRAGLELQPLRP